MYPERPLNGWNFHSDGIHLNSAGGRIVANLVQEFMVGDWLGAPPGDPVAAHRMSGKIAGYVLGWGIRWAICW